MTLISLLPAKTDRSHRHYGFNFTLSSLWIVTTSFRYQNRDHKKLVTSSWSCGAPRSVERLRILWLHGPKSLSEWQLLKCTERPIECYRILEISTITNCRLTFEVEMLRIESANANHTRQIARVQVVMRKTTWQQSFDTYWKTSPAIQPAEPTIQSCILLLFLVRANNFWVEAKRS